jgi:CHAT domain-containing protein
VAGKPVLRVRVLNVGFAKLTELVELCKRQIAARELGFSTLSSQLYATLLEPVQADLKGKSRVIVFPDGPLWELPFEALRGPSGKFLIEDFELFLAPSVTVLARMQSTRLRRTGAETLLALGDPASDLPEAKAEVTAIAKLYGQSRSKVYLGAEARKDTFFNEAGSYALLHVAAHGSFNDANPLYSYISLAAGTRPGANGDMEAREIMDLRLTARLAVLAGCETGKTTGSGEGLAGMAWAFFVAGTPATVASLWKVESHSTAELMTNLYSGLARGVAISTSLREAKLKLLRKPEYRHPFYWAGFVGIGAGF